MMLGAQTQIKLQDWRYAEADSSDWRPFVVPGVIQDFLQREGRLPDPHYRTNERLVQWPSERDWICQTSFELPEMRRLTSGEAFVLHLDGVDTYSEVYLNGQRVGETENMFVGYRFDVTGLVQRGTNRLEIRLRSPLRMAQPLQAKAGFNYPADNDHAEVKYSPFTRKAPFHYGWDWGMRFVTMGIHRPVRLLYYADKGYELEDLNIATDIRWQGLEAQSATLRVDARFASSRLRYDLELADDKGNIVSRVTNQRSDATATLEVSEPQLWTVRAWGQPYLYTLRIYPGGRGQSGIQPIERRIGIRELKLVHKPNQPIGQSSFYFELNKRPLYAKGVNYIPDEHIYTRMTPERYRSLMSSVYHANMNMIRVWGGGVYEDEAFYREADEWGILVWQDFMFGCTAYPADSAFLANVRREAQYQIRRLRHHPSIALWCGNNEVEEAIKYWGWQSRFSAEHYARMQADYDPLFRGVLAEEVARLDPERQYIHSSPTSANWGRPKTWLEGDSHYWGLWYGQEPFETFDDKRFAFVSEYGFQSFPDVYSLKRFALEGDMSLESEVMRQHQKASTGNKLIRKYMEREYQVPEDFERFVYLSLVMQARGMEHATRMLRYHRPTTMGALVWQLNDSWPSVSWSAIDYYGEQKPLYHTLRRAFADVAILPLRQGNKLTVRVANDRLGALVKPRLTLRLMSFDGRELRSYPDAKLARLEGNSTETIAEYELPEAAEPRDSYYQLQLYAESDGRERSKAAYKLYPYKPKDMLLPRPDFDVTMDADCFGTLRLRVRAKTFIKDLYVAHKYQRGLRYQSNLVDLAPGDVGIIAIDCPEGVDVYSLRLEDFVWRSLGEGGQSPQ